MVIAGLQKLSMVDFPGALCATVFLRGCDLRCPFCHNASLVLPSLYSDEYDEDELFAYLRERRSMLDGVCVTGGEPLLNRDISSLLLKIKELGYRVKLDTNGTRPVELKKVLEASPVDYIAMDIKNTPEKYPATTGIKNFDMQTVYESINILKTSGIQYEFRTTVVRELHSPSDISAIGHWLNGSPRYFLQAFRDSGELIGGPFTAYSGEEMESMAASVKGSFGEVGVRGV